MNRSVLLGALLVLVGCGEDERPGNLIKDPSGGARATGGKTGTAGKAGTSGNAGAAGRAGASARGGNAGTAGRSTRGGNAGVSGQEPIAGTSAGGSAGSSQHPTAPQVKVTNPKDVPDVNGAVPLGALSYDGALSAVCQITAAPNGAGLDTSSIAFQLTSSDGSVQTVAPTLGIDGYQYKFLSSQLLHGKTTLTCSAADKSADEAVGRDRIVTYVDKGPGVVVTSPVDKSQKVAYKASESLPVKFTVTPRPLSTEDKLAAITDVKVELYGADIPVESSTLGTYDFKIDLKSSDLFGTTFPTGNDVSFVIVATNARGARSVETRVLVVDQTAPTITITSPTAADIIGEDGDILFTVEDSGSGVELSQTTVTIPTTPAVVFTYSDTDISRWKCTPTSGLSNSSYKCTFHYTKTDLVQYRRGRATFVVNAADIAGNRTSDPSQILSATVEPKLDRLAPIVDLDPPNMRYVSGLLCSDAFDPLGYNAANDRKAGQSHSYGGQGDPPLLFRVFAWDIAEPVDLTNYPSMVDTDSVRIFVQSDSATPLLIDSTPTNGSNACDQINSTPSNGPAPIPLPVSPLAHTGDWSAMGKDPTVDPVPPPTCTLGNLTAAAPVLCGQTTTAGGMTIVLSHSSSRSVPVIFGQNPYGTSATPQADCLGGYWNFPASTPDGWLCVVAEAKDQAGSKDASGTRPAANRGISTPIRICFDNPLTENVVPSCKTSSETPPTCTDGCTPLDRFPEYISQFQVRPAQ